MLGWHVIIYREKDKGLGQDRPTVARWTTGPEGTGWLDRLVKTGLAQQTEYNGGYPLRYVGKAKDILPHLTSQPTPHQGSIIIGEDYYMLPGWKGQIEIQESLVSECLQSNDLLIVDAWDES